METLHADDLSGPLHRSGGGRVRVFLIGMRVNQPWRLAKWWPVFRAMPRMLWELTKARELGLLGFETHAVAARLRGGAVLAVVRSVEAYAWARNHEHFPALKAFNAAIGGQPGGGRLA